MEKIPISVIILTKNSQKYINKVCRALKDFDEVLVIDNGSTDDTLSIVKKISNIKIYKEEFIGFGMLRNKALKYAKNEWVLFVDSDEIVSQEMVEAIKKIDFSKKNYIYSFLRKNFYKNRLITCCGWENDYVKRLFNKTYTKYSNRKVHEDVIIKEDSKIVYIKDGFLHYAYDNINQLIDKMQYYSSLWANENDKKFCLLRGVVGSIFKFIKNYFFQKGFIYGFEGFVISICNSLGVLFKYLKLYERKKYEN